MKRDDALETNLNPHRADERAQAGLETAARLHRRGIEVTGKEDSEELDDLLTAVEKFEEVVQVHGGDLMVDDLKSSQPDDPHFVVPRRREGETLASYTARIEAATANLRSHPSLADTLRTRSVERESKPR